jgi:hypothetical protein
MVLPVYFWTELRHLYFSELREKGKKQYGRENGSYKNVATALSLKGTQAWEIFVSDFEFFTIL